MEIKSVKNSNLIAASFICIELNKSFKSLIKLNCEVIFGKNNHKFNQL